MEESLAKRPHRKRPLELQLTAMIDIFSMIVIFLILGSVFGASTIAIPEGMILPKSNSKETLDPAPDVTVTKDSVTSSFAAEPISIADFSDADKASEIRAHAARYLQNLPEAQKKKIKLLSIIADRELPYAKLFAVIRVYREAGFDTLMFSATGEGVSK